MIIWGETCEETHMERGHDEYLLACCLQTLNKE